MKRLMSLTIISEQNKKKMKVGICDTIMRMRKDYAKRRQEASRILHNLTKVASRRERIRKGRMTSMKLFKMIICGKLRYEDAMEEKRLEQAAIDCQEDVEKSLECLKEVKIFIDDLVVSPRLNKDAKYEAWKYALNTFIEELKKMAHYSIKPSREENETVDMMIRMLEQMKIAEGIREQTEIRWGLTDGLTYLLEHANKKMRRLGL